MTMPIVGLGAAYPAHDNMPRGTPHVLARQRRGRRMQRAKACACESSGSARLMHSLRQRLLRR